MQEGHLQEACAYLASAGAGRVMGTYKTISAGPVFLALRVDALLRLDRLDEAAAAISEFEAFDLGHILVKLGFSSRAQIAAWAAQRRAPAP